MFFLLVMTTNPNIAFSWDNIYKYSIVCLIHFVSFLFTYVSRYLTRLFLCSFAVPGVVINPTVVADSSTAILIKWLEPAEKNGNNNW